MVEHRDADLFAHASDTYAVSDPIGRHVGSLFRLAQQARDERDALRTGIQELLDDMHVPMSIEACRRLQVLINQTKE